MSEQLQAIGLKEARIKDLTTKESLRPVLEKLLEVLKACNVTTASEEVGSLLDELVTKLRDSKHLNTIAQYVVSGKIRRVQLQATFRYILALKDGAFNAEAFEKECGVGVVVTPEAIASSVTALCDSQQANLDEKKWNFQGQLFTLAKSDNVLKWADGKALKDVVEAELTKRLGAKAAAPAKKEHTATTATTKVNEAELDPSQYKELRQVQIQKLRENGIDPFPHKFSVSISLPEFREKYASQLTEKGKQLTDRVQVAGRVVHRRDSSAKLIFFEITQDASHIQVLANFSAYQEKEQWAKVIDVLRRGDIIGVDGYPASSNTGELSILPVQITLLAPCFQMLPHTGKLKEVETRYRNRHLDMLVNPQVIKTFTIRSKIIQFIRRYFDAQGFLEVETPTMNILAGGATAKPFITYHNDLGVNLFMRVAPELYLKQLIIGGMHKVYEIGKNYRNEGIDLTHNPEFTAIECYEAFADYEDWIKKTEDLLSKLVLSLHGTYKIPYYPHGHDNPEVWELDFTPPFKRVPMISTLEKRLEVKFPEDLTTPEANKFFVELCKKHEVECNPPHTTARLLDALVGEYLEKDLINPGFITDQPQLMCPLAKYHRNTPGLTERFELFVAKKEICNSYTELNDPEVQRRLFQGQSADRAAGDDEAQPIDEDYVTAMQFGLPPTGGWGMGIDRLTMMLTGNSNIKEVILFPAMRPLEAQVEAQRQQLKGVTQAELDSLTGK